MLRDRSLKVATPFCGVTVSVPLRPLPLVSASVTGLVALVTTLPLPSCICTWTAGVIVAWVSALVGCTENATFTGTAPPPLAAVMLKLLLAAVVSPGLVAESS